MYTYVKGKGWLIQPERTITMRCGTRVRLIANTPKIGDYGHFACTIPDDLPGYYTLTDLWYVWFANKHYRPCSVDAYYVAKCAGQFVVQAIPVE